jgi:hypothetical protein
MTAEEQAVVLVNEVRAERQQEIWKGVGDRRGYGIVLEALCRAIEQHEAFKQEVSDALEEYKADQPYVWKQSASDYFDRFIIPRPEPDPLVRVINEVIYAQPDGDINEATMAKGIRAALEARGLEIREKSK